MNSYKPLTTQDLLIKLSGGDEVALQQLYYRYSAKLGRYIFNITKSKEIAEEVVQDVFLKIWNNKDNLVYSSNFDGYLFIVSRNHALNCLKKEIRKRVIEEKWQQEADLIVEEKDPDILHLILDEAIAGLPPQQKTIYLLSRHQKLKYQEIANMLGLSKETIKKYLQRANSNISNYILSKKNTLFIFIFFILLLF